MKKGKETTRGSYTIPQSEQDFLNKLPDKFAGISPRINKSEIIRVGIFAVSQKKENEIAEILENFLGRLTVGKPKKDESENETTDSGIEITVNDRQWIKISKLFPVSSLGSQEGRPKVNYRQVINGILYIFRYKVQRRNIPENYGSFATCRRRLSEWKRDGKWKEICNFLLGEALNQTLKKELEGILLRTLLIDTKNE